MIIVSLDFRNPYLGTSSITRYNTDSASYLWAEKTAVLAEGPAAASWDSVVGTGGSQAVVVVAAAAVVVAAVAVVVVAVVVVAVVGAAVAVVVTTVVVSFEPQSSVVIVVVVVVAQGGLQQHFAPQPPASLLRTQQWNWLRWVLGWRWGFQT